MMSSMTRLRTSVRTFLTDESGVFLAEFLIVIPILIWGFIALIVYWDVFRTINVSQKAAYSIADLISRQGVVTQDFVDGLDNVLDFLTPGTPDSRMRITSFQLDEGTVNLPNFDADDTYCLIFSSSTSPLTPPLETDDLQQTEFVERIPELAGLESVVLVETWVDYQPKFDTGVLNSAPGVADQTFTQFIVTRPRNWRRVTLDGVVHGCT
jgi:Flp pilus assembly protein TadG